MESTTQKQFEDFCNKLISQANSKTSYLKSNVPYIDEELSDVNKPILDSCRGIMERFMVLLQEHDIQDEALLMKAYAGIFQGYSWEWFLENILSPLGLSQTRYNEGFEKLFDRRDQFIRMGKRFISEELSYR